MSAPDNEMKLGIFPDDELIEGDGKLCSRTRYLNVLLLSCHQSSPLLSLQGPGMPNILGLLTLFLKLI